MQSLQVSEIDRHRRFLIAAGTADYEHASPLPSVKDDLDRMVKAFQRLGYVCHQEDRILNPSVQDLRDKLSAWFMRPDVSSEDLVVVYYSGHSIGTRYRNYILTRNSDPQRLAATAL